MVTRKQAEKYSRSQYSVTTVKAPFLSTGKAKVYRLKLDRVPMTPERRAHLKAFGKCGSVLTNMPVMTRAQKSSYYTNCLELQRSSSRSMSLRNLKQALRPNIRK